MLITRHLPGAAGIPPALKHCIDPAGGPPVTLIGDPSLLDRKPVALFCSVQCPGDLIIKSYDLARSLRTSPATFIGGFQSPIEKEFLELLLRRTAARQDQTALPSPSVIVSPARGVGTMRVPRAWRQPLDAGRLLLLSIFPDNIRRPTAATAARRNACVAALADRFLVLHAAEGGKTADLCRQALAAGKLVYALDSPANAHLAALGAQDLSRLAL
ncbi:MAG: hypothetical protein OXF62_07645 [Caldilineaceae bacterium]|nr:hypothetical protein [Caldilineaceae bacterium]